MGKKGLPRHIRKRDGSIVKFDESRIVRAVRKAALEVLADNARAQTIAAGVTALALKKISDRFKTTAPPIEDIQDIVEASLMEEGYSHIARSYIIYRHKRSDIRQTKSALGLKDDLKLGVNTMQVLKKRYLLKDDTQAVIETPSEMFRRVAKTVAEVERDYKSDVSADQAEEQFYAMIRGRQFLPNSPTLMNAGTSFGQLSACFVLPVDDSIDGIFETLKNMARIHQTGGGTGFSFSRLRPKGALVSSTKGQASGPVSFMSIFDKATEVIVQGGRRRGANMGILRCDHPDIVDFIEAKMQKGGFENFNLSVAVTDRFMADVGADRDFRLVNPQTGKTTTKIKARFLFDLIVNAAWRTGDPGLVFIDEINRHNPTPQIGRIEATNPCGELPLLPFESCNLGSINLAKMVTNRRVDRPRLTETIHWAVRFLDNVIDVNNYPLEAIAGATLANRKIGLGVMGFADMLIQLGIPYNSPDAVDFAKKLMRLIHAESIKASVSLAEQRGAFPNFRKSVYAKQTNKRRNATLNTIAPTGTISIIAECSGGIEPLFAISFVRNVLSGAKLFETNPYFEHAAKQKGLNIGKTHAEIARQGSLQNVKDIPEDMKKLFVTAFDITPDEHLQIQAAFQKHTDNAVSKTINLPADATVEDVRRIYLTADRLKCKGITIYRYGSKDRQVLSFNKAHGSQSADGSPLCTADGEYSGGCAAGLCTF